MPGILIDKEYAWFWTKKWQEKEIRAEQDKKGGRSRKFNSVDEAVKWLRPRKKGRQV